MKRVYLAGPPFADEYRSRATELLRARGFEPVDPMRRDFRGRTEGNEREIVEGDLADIDACDVVLADFTKPDEGTAMEAWYAHSRGTPVVAYTGEAWAHPWTVYVAAVGFPIAVKIPARLIDLYRPLTVERAYEVHVDEHTNRWNRTGVARRLYVREGPNPRG